MISLIFGVAWLYNSVVRIDRRKSVWIGQKMKRGPQTETARKGREGLESERILSPGLSRAPPHPILNIQHTDPTSNVEFALAGMEI